MSQAYDTTLFSAAALPTSTSSSSSGGYTYAAAQYNGAAIQVADMTPPKFLNIAPKVVNKLAHHRNANNVNFTQATAPVSVVKADAPPKLPTNLQTLLQNSQWGNAFIGLVQDIRTPIQITVASINSIFAWGKGVVDNNDCRNSYVQAIVDLLQLPSGIKLFRNIIIAHHCLPKFPKVQFKSTERESYTSFYKYTEVSEINLQWIDSQHTGSDDVYIVKNNSLPVDTTNPNAQLDFITVKVPASVVLAHELGHYLYDLIACKAMMEVEHVDTIGDFIISQISVLLEVAFDNAMKLISRQIKHYVRVEYDRILKQIISSEPTTPAQILFVGLWNSGEYYEMVNILPVASMLQQGDSDYDDGTIVGEAYKGGKMKGQNVFTKNGQNVTFSNGVTLSASNFVRFSHRSSKYFNKKFNALDATGKAEFKNLVATMLGLIKVKQASLGADDLPCIT
jgi:hypothetical protein